MIAAIYARKSTEQHGLNSEEKSVTRQIEHAKAYAAQKGWTISEDYIYQDDGVSGAEFVKRPGFLRLMNALKPRPVFQVLIMSEESRLGREAIETSYALKQIIDAGVQVFFYLTDQERRLDSAMDKVMLSLANFASEMEREKAKQRTHDAMMRKAKVGYVLGGKVYGYDNVDVFGEAGTDGKSRRQHVIRRVNEEEARVVRDIFTLSASGWGLTRIAKHLNTQRVSPPRKGPHGWAPSALREILYRDLYRGIVWWNRTETVQRGGTKKQRRRPQSEWLRLDAPELQIVSDDVWQQVHSRLKKVRHGYLRGEGGRLLGRASGQDIVSKYLLSGLAKCGTCGSSLVGVTRKKGKHERHVYRCMYHHKRGAAICDNNVQIRQDVLDSVILQALSEAIDDRVREEAVIRALKSLRANQVKMPDRRTAVDRELSLIEARLGHLVEAVARGEGSAGVFAKIKAEEERKQILVQELASLNDMVQVTSLDAKRLSKALRERVRDVPALLREHVPQARQVLRKLLDGPVICDPIKQEGKVGYRFKASGTFGRAVSMNGGQLLANSLPSTIPSFA